MSIEIALNDLNFLPIKNCVSGYHQIYENEFVNERFNDLVHYMQECVGSALQPKKHDKPFIQILFDFAG